MSEKLTDEQIKNWREVLVGMIGPYALIMPKEEIQAFRDKTQNAVQQVAQPNLDKPAA